MEELHLQINFMLNNLVIRHEISTRSQYILCTLSTGLIKNPAAVQVNLCQKLLFLRQLTHNMTTDCSLNYKFNA